MAYGRTVEHKIRAFHVHAIFDFAKKTSPLFHSQSFRQLHHCHWTYSNCHIPLTICGSVGIEHRRAVSSASYIDCKEQPNSSLLGRYHLIRHAATSAPI